MTKKKILIIGSGPIVIGQAAEFDYSGAQVSLSCKEEGYETIIINNNPATIQTDKEIADKVYIEPLKLEYIEKVIIKEKPWGIIVTAGGQTALNLGKDLFDAGIIKKYGLKVLGTSIDSIKKGEDRGIFKEICVEIGEPVLPSIYANNIKQATDFASKIGFPIIIRAGYTLGGTGSSTAYDMNDLIVKAQEGFDLSPVKEILLEKSLLGTAELEYEMMRDEDGNKLLICVMENIDPMGVHTGESIVIAPSQTLNDSDYQKLRDSAFKIIEELKIMGGCNVQFALDQESGEYYVIEVNPRLSRSSALASKATGYPIARIAAKVALGHSLVDIKNPITGKTAFFEPALDYVVIKIPRWPDDKFPTMNQSIGVTMKSTGEVMAIGRSFEEAMYKAISSLDTKLKIYDNYLFDTKESIKKKLEKGATTRRLSHIFAAFRLGLNDAQIIKRTKINRWFMSKLRKLYENRYQIGENINCYKMVDTCAGEFEALTPYFYSTSATENEAIPLEGDKIIILGSGPIRIGQGIEFDYMTVHAVKALQKKGIKVIIINNNPETVSTDFSISDRLYFEPLTMEFVDKVIQNESQGGNLLGIITQFGGQTAINLAGALESFGYNIIGTSSKAIEMAENRKICGDLLKSKGYKIPSWSVSNNVDELRKEVEVVGYPSLIRPSFVLGGEGMKVVHEQKDVESYIESVLEEEEFDSPILIDQFINESIEIDIDFLSDGAETFSFVIEQIDPAGVHSGDSHSVYPAQVIDKSVIKYLNQMATSIAKDFNIIGLGNIQCALKIKDSKLSKLGYLELFKRGVILSIEELDVYIIEINPRASRTVPFVSKVLKKNIAEIATAITVGDKLKDHIKDLQTPASIIAIKQPVFSTHKLVGVHHDLGPIMRSTGEAMYTGSDLNEALIKMDGGLDGEVYEIS